MSKRSSVRKAVCWFDAHFEDFLAGIFYGYMAIVIAVEVARRYLFNASSSWAEETAVYAFIWLAYLSASSAVRDRAHLSFNLLERLLPPKADKVVKLLSDGCFFALALLIVYTSMPTVLTHLKYNQLMLGVDLPMVLASAAVPVGWSLVMLRIVQRAIKLFQIRGSVSVGPKI